MALTACGHLPTAYSLKLVPDQLDLDAHALEGDARVLAVAHYVADALLVEAGAGDEHLIDPLLLADAPEVAVAAVDAQAVDHLPLLERVVVHEPDRLVLEFEVVAYLAQQKLPGVARAVDEHATAARVGARQHPAEEAEGHAAPRQHQEEDHRVEGEDGAREGLERG